MADFKIAIGLELENESKAQIQKIIDDIRNEKPEIKVNINTEQALKDIKTLQKELKKLKDVKIKVDVGSSKTRNRKTSSNVTDFLSTDTNNVSWKTVDKNKKSSTKRGSSFNSFFDEDDILFAREVNDAYNELMSTMKRMATLRSQLQKKKPNASEREIDMLNDEISRIESNAKQILTEYGAYFSDKQKNRINEARIQGGFKIHRAGSQVEDKAQVEELTATYKNLLEIRKQIGETEIKIAKLDKNNDKSEIEAETRKLEELNAAYDETYQAKKHLFTAEQTTNLTNAYANTNKKVADEKKKIAKAEQKAIEKASIKEIDNAVNDIKKLDTAINSLEIQIAKLDKADNELQLDALHKELNEIKQARNELAMAFGKDLSQEQFADITNNLDRLNAKLEITEAKVVDTKIKLEEKTKAKALEGDFKYFDNLGNSIDKVRERLAKLDTDKNSNEVKVLTKTLNELESEYKEVYSALSKDLTADQFDKIWKNAEKASQKLEQIESQVKDKQLNMAKGITAKFDGSGTGAFTTEINTLVTKMSTLSNVSDGVKADITQLRTLVDTMVDADDIGDIDKLINSYDEYCQTVKKVKNELKDLGNAQKLDVNSFNLQDRKTRLGNDIDIWLQKNSAAARDFGHILEQVKAQIQGADKIKLDRLEKEFKQVKQEAQLAGKTGLSFADSIKKQWDNMKSYFTLYDVYSYAKQGITSMFQEVVKVDTAMSGLYRVTDLTTSQYETMYDGMVKSAKEYGLVLSDLIDGATTWAKLGFSGEQASELAEISGRYQVVADTDTETAVGNLITAYKGFQNELLNLYNGDSTKAVEYVSDIFNKLGNEFAIDAESVGLGLTKAASALGVAGNTIQESAGMLTGVSEITNAPERAGNMLKILSLRLRGKYKFRYKLNYLCLHTRKVRMLCCIL